MHREGLAGGRVEEVGVGGVQKIILSSPHADSLAEDGKLTESK